MDTVLNNFRTSQTLKDKDKAKAPKGSFDEKSFKSLDQLPLDNKRLVSISTFLTAEASEEDKQEYVDMMKSVASHLDWKGEMRVTPFSKNRGGTQIFISKFAPAESLASSKAFVASLLGSASI